MAYGSLSYGSASYGGEVASGVNSVQLSLQYTVITNPTPLTESLEYKIGILKAPITFSLGYAVGVQGSTTKSLTYSVATSNSITLSLQYVVRPILGIPLKYSVVTTPSPITKSIQYQVGTTHTITESLQYDVGPEYIVPLDSKYTISWHPAKMVFTMMYVVIPQITDDDDYSKGMVIAEYVTTDLILWNNIAVNANAVTNSVDVSSIGSLGVYMQVDSATTINVQVLTADGWQNYDSISFSGSGSQFYSIWFFSFTQIRFQTTASATITIQVFLRT